MANESKVGAGAVVFSADGVARLMSTIISDGEIANASAESIECLANEMSALSSKLKALADEKRSAKRIYFEKL